MKRQKSLLIFATVLTAFFILPHFFLPSLACGIDEGKLRFEVSFSADGQHKNITGRIYLIMTKSGGREPRLQRYPNNTLMWGVDIFDLKPGETAIIDGNTLGFPVAALSDISADEYYVQGFVNVYTQFKRSDGFTLWMHNDQWEGQHWNRSPGNLYSKPVKIVLDPQTSETIKLVCDNVIPPVEVPPDTRMVKRIKFESEMLTKFWGQPVYLGATILLPKGYDTHPDVHYPVNYIQGHFSLRSPYGFRPVADDESDSRRRANPFTKFWLSDSCPRMIAVTFQHPCTF